MDPSHEQIIDEVHEIEQDVQQRKAATSQSWTVLFTHRPLFNRLWRASLLQFMAQMCGNVSLKYYLPTVLMGLGVPRKTTLLIGGIELTIKIGFTIVDTWLVDHYGRRLTLVASCLVMSIALMVCLLLVTNTRLRLTIRSSMELYPSHTQTTSAMRPTTHALRSYSSTRSHSP